MPVMALTLAAALVGQGCHPSIATAPSPRVATARASADATNAPVREALGPEPEVPTHARGMWVWATKRRLADRYGTAVLLETCHMAGLDEVYLSVNDGVLDATDDAGGSPGAALSRMLVALQAAGVRVEALAGRATWYQPSARAELLGLVDAVAAFNARSPGRFAAVHLDIEPHQLPENQTDHGFLPALAEAIGAARDRAREHRMSLSADLPRFAYEEAGPLFAAAAPRTFVMLYQLREKTTPWLLERSEGVLDAAFRGGPSGRVVVGLRMEDYPDDIEQRVSALDAAYAGRDERYGGWAIHDEAKYRARPSRP